MLRVGELVVPGVLTVIHGRSHVARRFAPWCFVGRSSKGERLPRQFLFIAGLDGSLLVHCINLTLVAAMMV